MDEKDILELRSKYEFQEYLKKLQEVKDNCLILMAVKDTAGDNLSNENIMALRKLGFRTFSNKLWVMHLGIIVKGIVIKDISGTEPENNLESNIVIDELNVQMSSKAWKQGNDCIIKINGIDYAQKVRGINIVVYDLKQKCVIDSIGFDSHAENSWFKRNYMKFKKEKYIENSSAKNILSQVLVETKIRIVHMGLSYFGNVMESLAYELSKIAKVDVKIISGAFAYDSNSIPTIVGKYNFSHEFLNAYDIENDRPDILIFMTFNDFHVYRGGFLERFRNNSKLLICLPVCLILNAHDSMRKYEINLINKLKDLKVDYLIMDKYLYHKCLQNNINEEFMIEIGNPKFDKIYSKISSAKEWINEWEKIKGKRIILWLPDHDWENGTNVSFDLYAKKIFKILEENQELGLIFRPHPRFVIDTKRLEIWNDSDETKLRNYINNSPNIVWDERADYSLAYQCADYIFSDVESGTIISSMVTKKPICIMYRYDCIAINNNQEVTDNFYSVRCEEDLDNIIDMIKKGEDPMREQRCNAIDNFVSHFDGKNGERIKDFILEKYYEKFGRDVNNE